MLGRWVVGVVLPAAARAGLRDIQPRASVAVQSIGHGGVPLPARWKHARAKNRRKPDHHKPRERAPPVAPLSSPPPAPDAASNSLAPSPLSPLSTSLAAKGAPAVDPRLVYDALMSPLLSAAAHNKQSLLQAETDLGAFFAHRQQAPDAFVELMTAQRAQGMVEKVEETFRVLKELHPPTVQAYTTLISALGDRGRVADVLRCLEDMQQAGVQPTLWTYTAATKALVNGGHLGDAFQFVRKVEDANIKLDQVIFAPLIQGCLDDGDVHRAWRTFHYMREHHAEPDEVTFSLMLRACAMRAEAERAENILHEMTQMRLVPTEVTYLNLIACCAKRPDYLETTFGYFNLMKDEGFVPDRRVYNTLLSACAQCGDVARANKVIAEMAASDDDALQPDEVTYNIFLHVLARAQRRLGAHPRRAFVDRAWKVYEEMVSRGNAVSVVTLNTLLGVVSNNRTWQRAEKWRDLLFARHNLEPDRVTFLQRAHMLLGVGQIDRAWELAAEADAKGWHIDGRLRVAFVHACHARPDHHDKAIALLHGIDVDVHQYVGCQRTESGVGSLRRQIASQRRAVFKGSSADEVHEAQQRWDDHVRRCRGCYRAFTSWPFRKIMSKNPHFS